MFDVRAGVAQLVEQRFRKPQVVRSIRIAGSICHADKLHNTCGCAFLLVERTTWGFKGGVPPSWGSYKGAGPLCRNR